MNFGKEDVENKGEEIENQRNRKRKKHHKRISTLALIIILVSRSIKI